MQVFLLQCVLLKFDEHSKIDAASTSYRRRILFDYFCTYLEAPPTIKPSLFVLKILIIMRWLDEEKYYSYLQKLKYFYFQTKLFRDFSNLFQPTPRFNSSSYCKNRLLISNWICFGFIRNLFGHSHNDQRCLILCLQRFSRGLHVHFQFGDLSLGQSIWLSTLCFIKIKSSLDQTL